MPANGLSPDRIRLPVPWPWLLNLLITLGAILIGASSAKAEMFVPLTIEQLTQKAGLIVHAKVIGKSCQQDETGFIYTRMELDVNEVWRGELKTNPLVVVHGGGRIGNREIVVTGQVHYQIGEEVVAFLVRNRRGQAVTIGLAQGKFQIWQDPASGHKLAHNVFYGAQPHDTQRSKIESSPLVSGLTLPDLKQRVKGVTP